MKKDPKLILIGILLLVLIVLIITKLNFREKKIFEIEDKCGKFVNLVSHTIEDEAACETRCRAQCISSDHKYGKVEFEKSDVGCNSCTCFCK
jgi:hypothetical protein